MPSEALIERYRDAAIALLPPGRAISKSLDSAVGKLMKALAVEPARLHEDAEELLDGAIPSRANDDYTSLWEEALQLPGDCVQTPPTTLSERRGAVIARLRGRTSHARSAFEAAASALGYTDLEFVTFPPMTCVSACTDSLYGDEWANVVRVYVPHADQTADDSLHCIFVDQLRRSHGFIDVVLEGPMGATRTNTVYISGTNNMGANITPTGSFNVSYGGHVSFQVTIDNGAGGNPSDTPVGSWKIYATSDGVNFTEVKDASGDTEIADELAKIAPNGNTAVSAYAIFDNFPGTAGKIAYVRSSGGGTDASARVCVTSW